ncbi:hypothetical protein EDB92DRAFT_1470192 [Lactarius akahatsu]|uniref:Uncharacterized protein n=1 Tax=Lactarius akahatsu TaxID=416441 RepID=A0AAD4LDU3_9AGAM|nr:hypothetical protein EDB92DRAFT_1470192 [Lactarius akahatsu]
MTRMLRTFHGMSLDYTALLPCLRDLLQLRTIGRIVQFPSVLPAVGESADDEIALAGYERRKQVKRLREYASIGSQSTP